MVVGVVPPPPPPPSVARMRRLRRKLLRPLSGDRSGLAVPFTGLLTPVSMATLSPALAPCPATELLTAGLPGCSKADPFARGTVSAAAAADRAGLGPNPGGGADRTTGALAPPWLAAAAPSVGPSTTPAGKVSRAAAGAAGDSAATGGLRTRPFTPNTAGGRLPSSGKLRVRVRTTDNAEAAPPADGRQSIISMPTQVPSWLCEAG